MMKKDTEIKGRKLPALVLGVLFCYMLLINSYMPMMADDYRYAMNWSQTGHLSGIGEIAAFQVQHYMEWGGRSIAHSIAQLMLLAGKPVFNVANSIVFLAFLLLLYWHAVAAVKKSFRTGLLLSVVFFCWFCLPTFGETAIWLVGSCNYLWMTTFVLGFLLPYRLAAAGAAPAWLQKGGTRSLLMFIFGIIAGWTNENTGMILLLASGSAAMYCWKKRQFASWMLWGFAGALLGYGLLLGAPGNYSRMLTAEQGNYSLLQNHLIDPLKTMGTLFSHQLPIYITLFVLLRQLMAHRKQLQKSHLWSAWKEQQAEILYSSALYIALSFVAQLMMFASPTFPQRAGFGAAAFLIIGVLSLLRLPLYENFIVFRKERLLSGIIAILWLGLALSAAGKYHTLYLENQQRLAYIAECQAAKLTNIQVRPFSIEDRSALGIVVVNDIGSNAKVFRSLYYARYFGFESMSREK